MDERTLVHLKRSKTIVIWMLVTTLFMQAFLPATASAGELARVQAVEQELVQYRNAIAAHMQTNSISYATGSSNGEAAEHVSRARSVSTVENHAEGSSRDDASGGQAPDNAAAEGRGDEEPTGVDSSNNASNDAEPQVEERDQGAVQQDSEMGVTPADATTTAEEDAAAIEGAEVLSNGEDGDTGKVLLADENAVTNGIDGRDYEGQISIDINGNTYILIGNEQQLRAIGTGAQAHGRVYHYYGGLVPTGLEMYYPGDADLTSNEKLNGTKFTDLKTEFGRYYCGQGTDGNYDFGVTANPDLYYTADANYIIFRDINLNKQVAGEPEGDLWTPMMFTGIMLGANSTGMDAGELKKLISSPTTVSTTADAPTISNVTVSQTGKLDSRAFSGVGFFGTISSGLNLNDLGKTAGQTVVSNLRLDTVSVTNQSTETEETQTLISGLTDVLGTLLNGIVGGLIGGLLDTLLGLLGGILGAIIPESAGLTEALQKLLTDTDTGLLGNLGDALEDILDLRKKDPTTFATGAFAGRIIGDVNVNNCVVTNASVENAPEASAADGSVNVGMTGGFVGYMEGVTEYDGLSDGLKITVDGLQTLLNIIPGIGLGDLLQLLKGNVIDTSKLIPTGYYNPVISGCSVSLNDDSIGTADTSYAGGFAGVQIGAIVENSNVEAKHLAITAERFAGGFAGLMRDAEMEGLLNNLGVKLIEVGQPQSLALGSSVSALSSLTVTANDHAGGFTGALAASHIVASKVNVKDALDVSATAVEATPYAGFAGGMVGEATLGWVTNLGFDDDDKDVLGLLSTALSKVLESGSNNSGELLTLMGFTPAAVMGSAVSAKELTVHSETSYAGGLVGHGEGTLIDAATQTNLEKLSHWKSGGRYSGQDAPSAPNADASNSISGLSLVTAKDGYAGGIAGMLETAAVGGLLNKVVGVGSVPTVEELGGDGFNAFRLAHTTVNKQADSTAAQPAYAVVTGGLSAGGAVGSASGGSIEGIAIDSVASVIGAGEVGGFIGQAASGSLVGTKGLDILGLVKVSGLLSVAQYSALSVTDCSVTGRTPAEGAGPKVEEAPKLETDPSEQTTEPADAGLLPANQSPYLTVIATGANQGEASQITAGGFFGRASSLEADRCAVNNLGLVQAPEKNGNAGGFVGLSTTGGLASIVADDDGGVNSNLLESILGGKLLSISDLLGAVPWMIPEYRETHTDYLNGGWVTADIAGGYAGLFESGSVNVFDGDNPVSSGADVQSLYAVKNIAAVRGTSYAGGFGGKVVSGSLAKTGGGLSLLDGTANLDLTNLLGVIQAYVPTIKYADVLSENGFTVTAAQIDSQEQTTSGAAGGFIGYGTAVQVSYSDVSKLAHTTVTPPDDLEAQNAPSYFNSTKSTYAVTAPQFAGGYFGYLDIGSTAGAASGLELLKQSEGMGILGEITKGISVSDLTNALNVMTSTVEHSDVYGHAGGFSVRASGEDSFDAVGHAGGFAGKISGGHIQDSNVDNFAYVIGQIAAGGYVGELVPGSVADVLGEATVGEDGEEHHGLLDKLVNIDSLASLAQAFVPTIRNSQTTCVPCGGAVRAQALSTKDGAEGGGSPIAVQRGMAGGYVGHNLGGQIWGNNNAPWKNKSEDGKKPSPYNGPQREAAAIRIRSVYGAEYAGGFTGLMEPGSTAETGGLSLLWGLIKTNNLLNVMQDIYPTEENTAVYGPLRGLTPEAWNTWVDAVGVENVYGALLGDADGDGDHDETDDATATLPGHVESQEQIDALLDQIAYGTNVVAGRAAYEAGAYTGSAGVAGGYVGSMVAGTITNGQAHDTKLVRAMRAAGGFVGAAETGGVAELGSADILGISLDLGELLPDLVSVFVPVIKCSSVTGYRQGMTVESFGSAPADSEGQHETDTKNGTGFAGGYIGFGSGAQIWGDADTARNSNAQPVSNTGCTVSGLRRVSATAYAGGFAGKLCVASVASADTNASDGFLQGLLDKVIGGTGITNLAEVLQASMSTVRNAHVSATATDEEGVVTAGDASWGFTIDAYTTGEGDSAQKVYPIAAGGFAGSIEATVLGELTTNGDDPDAAGGDNLNLPVNKAKGVSVSGLRGVDGGNFAGGLVGLADVAGAADVASGDTEGAGASVLKLIGLGGVSVLQAFQPCIYAARVDGVADGLTVRAHEADTGGLLTAERRSGNAGGFIGSIMSGAVRESSLTNLSTVSGPSYTGGFIGYTGKSGVLDVEDASLLERLIGLDASAVNTFSTLVQNSTVAGIPAGYTVASTGSDVSEGEDAWQISGGFVGYADLAHITGCHASALKRVGSGEVAGGFAGKGTHAYLVSADANSPLVKALLVVVGALVKALWLDELQTTGFIDIKLSDWVLHLQVEGGGSTLKVSLLGIPIEVTLNDENEADNVAVAHVKIGSSTIDLNVSKDDQGNVTIDKNDASNIAVNLIKANMTVIEGSSVTGIADGYDVFAGGSTQTTAAMDGDSSDKESGFAGGFMGWSDEAQLKDNEMLYADVVKGTAGLVAPFAGRTDYDSAHLLDTVDKQITGNTYHVYRGTELAGETLSGTIIQQREDSSVAIQGKLDNGDPATDGTASSAEDAAWARFDIKGHKPVAGKSNHDDWKDATAGDVPLDVWRDGGATAVLMANAAVSDNTGALTPEPEEGQDPCAATADLTITKVWDDHGDALHRPESIEVELWQSYTDANDKVVRKPYDGMLPNNGGSDGSGITSSKITLSAAEASPWSNTWQHVVKMLPVAWDDNGTIRYFSYSVKEVTLDGGGKDIADYSTTVTPGEDGAFHIVITNRLPLPITGGSGTTMLLLAGLAALVLGATWLEYQRMRRGAAAGGAQPAGNHFGPRVR